MSSLSSFVLLDSNIKEERNCCSVPFVSFHFHGILKWFGGTFKDHLIDSPPCAGMSFIDQFAQLQWITCELTYGCSSLLRFFSANIEVNVLYPSLQARSSPHDVCRNFLIDFAKSDPAQDFSGQKSELFKGLIQACKKQTPKTDIVAGSTVDQAVNSTFAALVYLTPDLFEKLQKYGNSNIIRLS